MASETTSKKRQDEDEVEDTHRQGKRSDWERRQQQNLNQGMNMGTEDVQRISDWGSTRSSKKKSNGNSGSSRSGSGSHSGGESGNKK